MVAPQKGSLVQKLKERNPEPVTTVFAGVVGPSPVVTVNPFDGFVADVEVRIRRTDLAAKFELKDNDGNVLDDVDVVANGNGILKAFLQQSERAVNVGVVPNTGATYDFTVNILRHRITGVV